MATKYMAPTSQPVTTMDAGGDGWLVFASIVLGVAGVMRIFDAIWAFRYHGTLPQNLEDAVFGRSLNTYGWIYVAVAAILIACAVFVLQGSQIARWVGVAAGALGAISASWWLPYYPVWSLVYVALGAFVIYALVAHGGRSSESRTARGVAAYPPSQD